jgi:hypothetical protein
MKCRILHAIDYGNVSARIIVTYIVIRMLLGPVFKIRYCHVSGVPRLIITGFGLDDWIY